MGAGAWACELREVTYQWTEQEPAQVGCKEGWQYAESSSTCPSDILRIEAGRHIDTRFAVGENGNEECDWVRGREGAWFN